MVGTNSDILQKSDISIKGETGGEFHMHGGIINVTTKQDSGVTVVGIHNDPVGGVSHTLATCVSVTAAWRRSSALRCFRLSAGRPDSKRLTKPSACLRSQP